MTRVEEKQAPSRRSRLEVLEAVKLLEMFWVENLGKK
jgi:hypothetical protein